MPALRDEIDLGVNEIAGLADLASDEQEPRHRLTRARTLTLTRIPNQDPRHHLTRARTLARTRTLTRIPATT